MFLKKLLLNQIFDGKVRNNKTNCKYYGQLENKKYCFNLNNLLECKYNGLDNCKHFKQRYKKPDRIRIIKETNKQLLKKVFIDRSGTSNRPDKREYTRMEVNTIIRVANRNYIKVKLPRKWKPYARFVWEKYYGKIISGDCVHHINKIPNDDRIENLLAMPIKRHFQIHVKQNGIIDKKEFNELKSRYKLKQSIFELPLIDCIK